MTINTVPKVLYENRITEILDDIKTNHGQLTRKGIIYGLIAIDQDAKIIAIDSHFDRQLNYWDLSSVGAAMYGVSRQGMDFFKTDYLERATIIYNNLQLFVKSIGEVNLKKKGKREILIVLLSDRDVNIGVIILQMDRFSVKIREEIELSGSIRDTLRMSERQFKKHLRELKKTLFSEGLAISGE